MRARIFAPLFLLALAGCAGSPSGPSESPGGQPARRGQPAAEEEPGEGDPQVWLDEAELALRRGEPARAATLFSRYLGRALHARAGAEAEAEAEAEAGPRRAYRGLAQAHEQLGDFDAAIRAYEGLLARFPDDPEAHLLLARRGAAEAEIGEWDSSAASYAAVLEAGGEALIPSQRVEALARRGYALYQLGRFDEADAVLAEADAIYEAATEGGEERFSDTYFVAMARFYRAAILHLRFRAVRIRLPEARMEEDFAAKLALLEQAQEAYNDVVRARHIYWVSAAGFQLGSLFEEFHDAIMYAPVPDWLDESQRRTYYLELEERLRPVIDKAVWVFEKNLETARRLGYDNRFVEQSEAALAHLQAVLLARGDPGEPLPRLAPREPRAEQSEPEAPQPSDELSAAERKLYVPMPTTL